MRLKRLGWSGLIVVVAGLVWWWSKGEVRQSQTPLPPTRISGWIAWWKESEGYDLAASSSGKMETVSPVWWLVDENYELSKAGKADRKAVVSRMKEAGVKIYPTLGSELSGKQLSSLFNDQARTDNLMAQLMGEIDGLPVDGIDVDLEGIIKEDGGAYISFLEKLHQELAIRNLNLSVTIKAFDGIRSRVEESGEDPAKIGKIADEVRVMAYDYHYAHGQPGAIAPLDWISAVAKYNLKLVPREKLVMGIPSYGYLWPDGPEHNGRQWDEFYQYLSGKEYTSRRDPESGELIVEGRGFTGWLSDGQAIMTKINLYRSLGVNRFIIWHLGGMDPSVFDTI